MQSPDIKHQTQSHPWALLSLLRNSFSENQWDGTASITLLNFSCCLTVTKKIWREQQLCYGELWGVAATLRSTDQKRYLKVFAQHMDKRLLRSKTSKRAEQNSQPRSIHISHWKNKCLYKAAQPAWSVRGFFIECFDYWLIPNIFFWGSLPGARMNINLPQKHLRAHLGMVENGPNYLLVQSLQK